jgi:hypothetical protein
MKPRRIPVLLLTLLPLAAVRPLDSPWRFVETTDDLTGASDRRLILRADNWNAPGAPDAVTSATLVLACGDRIPNVDGKSLLFYAGQPLEPFGNELAYAELRFDDQPHPLKAYFTIFDYGEAVVTQTGRRGARQVAFLGTDQSPYFSRPLFDQLTGATKLSVTYRAFSETHHVTFHVAGLNDALAQLSACHWTG